MRCRSALRRISSEPRTCVAMARALFLVLTLSAIPVLAQSSTSTARISFIGEVSWPAGRAFGSGEKSTLIGGLSGLTWVAETGRFLAVSDDPGAYGAPRFYTLGIDLEDGVLSSEDVIIESVTMLTEPSGRPFLQPGIDAEGIEITPEGRLLISSEGHVRQGVEPFLAEFERDGEMRRRLTLPGHLTPAQDGSAGPRHNLVFESLALTNDGRFLFTATESALVQDGPIADLDRGSPVRIVRFDLESGSEVAPDDDVGRWAPSRQEFLYQVEPVRRSPEPADGFRVNGLVDLLALSPDRLLALERSYSVGVGNAVSLFEVSLTAATEIGALESLARAAPGEVVPATKELLLDFDDLDLTIDNLEGMAFGPALADGRRTLVVVGDDNFNIGLQRTQILAFALGGKTVDISSIQGASHRSPLAGDWLRGVHGVVTAIDCQEEALALWIQDPIGDGDPATSEGVYVEVAATVAESGDARSVEVGDSVVVDGRVRETGRHGSLTVTTLVAGGLRRVGSAAIPDAVVLGRRGRRPPTEVVDDDGLVLYDPDSDAIDFFESLEGMRVEVPEPLVVGPTRYWGELVVTPDAGVYATSRTKSGGLLLAPGDDNPERLLISTRLLSEAAPAAAVGDLLEGPVTGVLHYDRSVFRLLPGEPLPTARAAGTPTETTELVARRKSLTLATFNVENLDALDSEEKFAGLARNVVGNLRSPDVLALQEIQDASGREDDGVTTADPTLDRLVGAIREAGGPDYGYLQIDPVDGADGGQPGGNIRVAFLFDPERVAVARRDGGTAEVPVRLRTGADGPWITPNPGRLAPLHPAFSGDDEQGFAGARKSLVLEVEFRGERIFIVNNHLKSKRGDDAIFGSRQPPLRATEHQRSRQTSRVRLFVEEVLTADPEAAVVVLGDMNDLEFRTPLAVLAGGVLSDLMESVPRAERYSFNYRGNSQLLDHILVSPGLARRAAPEVDIVHVSADQPDSRRFSDHDPIVVRLNLGR